jgi:hypothetical protein
MGQKSDRKGGVTGKVMDYVKLVAGPRAYVRVVQPIRTLLFFV